MDSAVLFTSFALGIFLFAMPVAANTTNSPRTGAAATRAQIVVARLAEESIPAADLPSPVPGPGSAPTPAINSGAGSSPVTPTNPNPAGWSTVPASPSTPASSATPGQETPGEESPDEEESDQARQAPGAAPTEVPDAIDIGSLTPTVQISDSSLAQLISTAPNPARAASLRITENGRVAIEHGDVDGAIRELAHAVSIDPSNSYAYLYLGRAYVERKNYDQALTFFKRAEIGLASNSAWLSDVYVFEGLCYEQSGRPSDAAASYQKALGFAPGNLRARVGYTRLSASVAPPPARPQAPDAAPPGAPEVSGPPPPPSVAPPPPPPQSRRVGTD